MSAVADGSLMAWKQGSRTAGPRSRCVNDERTASGAAVAGEPAVRAGGPGSFLHRCRGERAEPALRVRAPELEREDVPPVGGRADAGEVGPADSRTMDSHKGGMVGIASSEFRGRLCLERRARAPGDSPLILCDETMRKIARFVKGGRPVPGVLTEGSMGVSARFTGALGGECVSVRGPASDPGFRRRFHETTRGVRDWFGNC